MLNKKIIEKICKFSRKPFFEKNALNNIFSWDELENVLNLRPFVNCQRFSPITEKQYFWEKKDWLSDVNSYPPNLICEIVKTNVCYFNDASRINFKVNQICKTLEESTNSSSDAHIYFSLIEDLKNDFAKGFSNHYDLSDNLIVQVEGTSKIKVWDIPMDVETSNKKFDKNYTKEIFLEEWNKDKKEILLNITLEKGDVIYIPSFYWHEITSITKRVSISFPFRYTKNLKSFSNVPQERDWIKIYGGGAESDLLRLS